MSNAITTIGCRKRDRDRIGDIPLIGRLTQVEAVAALIRLAYLAPKDLLLEAFEGAIESSASSGNDTPEHDGASSTRDDHDAQTASPDRVRTPAKKSTRAKPRSNTATRKAG